MRGLTVRWSLAEAPDGIEDQLASYVAETGRAPAPYWDVVDVVGFLPPPGGRSMLTTAAAQQRMEHHLARVLAELG